MASPAIGLYLTPDRRVVVKYGSRCIPMPLAEYRANGYKPALEKLAVKPPPAFKPQAAGRGVRTVGSGTGPFGPPNCTASGNQSR
jgi:hypothetical protein